MSKKHTRRLTPQGWYKSPIAGRVHYQGSYEKSFMEYLDGKRFNWIKCRERFPYIGADGKSHTYNPDFYLPDHDLYVEVKGRIRVSDPYKFAAFPLEKKLALVDAEVLARLGIKCFVPPDLSKVDITKWPYVMLSKIPDYRVPGTLSEELKERLSKYVQILIE